MQGKVEICGINTARLEILKNDEMMELLRRTKQGDMAVSYTHLTLPTIA